MRLLVHVNTLEIGGSQTNAVDLAVQMAHRGHDVVLFGPEGPLADRAISGGIAYEPAPERPKIRPSPAVIRALLSAVDRHGIEVVHGYEWPPILECVYGPGLRRGTTVVGTVMSMGVAPFIPHHIPLVVGTANIRDAEATRRVRVDLLEPPVDLELDDPGLSYPDVRAELGATDELLVVVVGRIASELKLEGLLSAVEAVRRVGGATRLRLVIVGDGPARGEVEAAAAAANRDVARTVVDVIGSRSDPRPWYAGADVALGMGGSALRAMAFGKPLVVQGEQGFWRLLTPDTLPEFLRQGWYGVGDGGSGADNLIKCLGELAVGPDLRAELGEFGRAVVEERFSLHHAADLQEQIYAESASSATSWAEAPRLLAGPLARVLAYDLRRRIHRRLGRGAADDFNAIARQPGATTRNSHA